MRPPRRLFALFHAIVFVALSAFPANALRAKGQQAPNAPPADWDTAVRGLVDRIAAMTAPGRIDLTVNNISSLTPDDAATIGEALRAELTKRHFRLAGAQPPDANVIVTLSEGTVGYLIVAQVQQPGQEKDQTGQVAMVSVSKAAKQAKRNGGVSLDAMQVWQQPGAILDFALPPAAAGWAAEMIVLERGRIGFYSRQQDQWQLGQAVTITPTRSWLRAEQGHIDLSRGLAMGTAGIPGIQCKGDFANPQTIQCGFVGQDTQTWLSGDAAVPKGLDIGGDAVNVGLTCDGRAVLLATGKGDWTQPDFIQAYEMDATGRSAALTGNRVDFTGPVTALWAIGASGVARAVVHNLKTGNYEAYAVTASCSH